MKRPTTLLRLALAFVTGIVCADWSTRVGLSISQTVSLAAAALCLALSFALDLFSHRRSKKESDWGMSAVHLFRLPTLASTFLLLAVFFLGNQRFQSVHQQVYISWPEERTSYQAIVKSGPHPCEKTDRYLLDIGGRSVYGYLQRDTTSEAYQLSWGDTLILRGVNVQKPANRSIDFDYAHYLYGKRISGTVYIPRYKLASCRHHQGRTSLHARATDVQQLIQAKYAQAGLESDVLGVVETLTTGNRTNLDEAVRDAYREAGASHVLAISGLHVSVVFAMMMVLATLLFHSRRARHIVSFAAVLLLWVFAFIAGLSPSVVRAVLMCTIYSLATWAGGDRLGTESLALAALITLGINPFCIFDVGFLLSYAAMLAILTLTPPMTQFFQLKIQDSYDLRDKQMPKGVRKMSDILIGATAVSVAAQAGTLPLTLYHFGTFPTYFLITNLTVIPLLYIVLLLIVVWWIVSPTPLAPLLTSALALSVRAMNGLLKNIASWPGSQLTVKGVSALQAVVIAFLLFFFIKFLQKRPRFAIYTLLCFVVLLALRLLHF